MAVFSFADNTNPNSYSYKARKKRFSWFVEKMQISPTDKILDVGGAESTWLGTGYEKNITLLNIGFKKEEMNPIFQYIVGNACHMDKIEDKQFDVVFSNSVIEHVGKGKEQENFASEVKRVAKKYWIQTPNKHFPLEPHFLFPFFQYLPEKLQLWIGMNWKYSHLKRNNENISDELSRLKLLSKSEFSKLFTEASIIEEKFMGLTKSLIAYKV